MIANIIVLLVVVGTAFLLFGVFKKPSARTSVPNSIVRHRQKRTSTERPKQDLPDVAKMHEHDKKLKAETTAEAPSELFEFSLIQDPDEAIVKKIKSGVSNIRKPHPLLLALCRKTSEPKDLYDTIRKDPELVAKVINVANSPAFMLSKPITNLNHAIVFLGVVQVKSIATHFALQESVQFKSTKQQVAYARIWSAGFLASSIVLELAKAVGLETGAELSTRCQLEYLGDLAVLVSTPKAADMYLSNVDTLVRTKFVQDNKGTHQAFIAKILAEQWNLPKAIVDSLAEGLLPLTNEIPHETIEREKLREMMLCYISCRLADILAFNEEKDILESSMYSWKGTGRVEFYYSEEQLERAGLTSLHETLSNPTFTRKIHQFMEELKG